MEISRRIEISTKPITMDVEDSDLKMRDLERTAERMRLEILQHGAESQQTFLSSLGKKDVISRKYRRLSILAYRILVGEREVGGQTFLLIAYYTVVSLSAVLFSVSDLHTIF